MSGPVEKCKQKISSSLDLQEICYTSAKYLLDLANCRSNIGIYVTDWADEWQLAAYVNYNTVISQDQSQVFYFFESLSENIEYVNNKFPGIPYSFKQEDESHLSTLFNLSEENNLIYLPLNEGEETAQTAVILFGHKDFSQHHTDQIVQIMNLLNKQVNKSYYINNRLSRYLENLNEEI